MGIDARLSILVEEYLLACRTEGKSERTVEWYEQKLRVFVGWAGDPPASDLSLDRLRHFVDFLQRDYRPHSDSRYAPLARRGQLAAYTVRGFAQVVKGFCTWLVHEGEITSNPAQRLHMPKAPKVIVPALSGEQQRSLLAVPDRRTATGKHDYALLLLLLDTGLRAGEIVNARLEDLSLGTRSLKVAGKGSKERRVGWGDGADAALRIWLRLRPSAADTVFCQQDGRRMAPRYLWGLVRRLGSVAGIDGLHPHRLRHTFALEFLKGGGNAITLQRILGHSSLTMVRHYVDFSDADIIESQRQYSPMDRLNKGWSAPAAVTPREEPFRASWGVRRKQRAKPKSPAQTLYITGRR